MANAGNRNAMFIQLFEEDAVVAAAKPKACHGRPELFYIAIPYCQVAVNAMKDVESSFAINGAQIGLRLERPSNQLPRRFGPFTHKSNSRKITS
jgi:hypothetical protein